MPAKMTSHESLYKNVFSEIPTSSSLCEVKEIAKEINPHEKWNHRYLEA